MKFSLFSVKPLVLSAITLLLELVAPQLAMAQATPVAPVAPDTKAINSKVYTYVEQMPQMPGGVGNKAIVEAIQSHVVYPPQALRQALQGQVFVSFVVGEDGVVREAKIVKGLGGGCDETVLAAVAQLPRFTPGQQAGRPVAVSYTVPINFAISSLPVKQRHGR